MEAMVIVRVKWIIDAVARRKVVVMLGGILIDIRVAWKSISAPARLPNNFNGLHDILSYNQKQILTGT